MKRKPTILIVIKLFFLLLFMHHTQGQQLKSKMQNQDCSFKKGIVEVACGQCKFGMPGKGCDLAVRIKQKCYFVKGASIDSFGNAHAANGFCNAISKAYVIGTVKDSLFFVKFIQIKNK
jgi:hypothetical protein